MEHSYTGELPQASPVWPRAVVRPQGERTGVDPGTRRRAARRRFDLLRWFSIASLVALVPVAAATGALLSHFVAEQALRRDANLTAEFVRNCVLVESGRFGTNGLVPYLDTRADPALAGLDPDAVSQARDEVFEHLEVLPGALVTNIYAPDRRLIWSTNKVLVGTYARDDEELGEAFATRKEVARHHGGTSTVRHEMKFLVPPQGFFVENYVPLLDGEGRAAAVVEVYKEPGDLAASIRSVQLLVWTATLVGGVIVYLGLFSVVRRGSRLLRQQQKELVEAESQLFVGELATALAHSLRNPLSSVRNSAEIAQCSKDPSARKQAEDIITQVDFLSQWIRELLLYSRPLAGEPEPVDLQAVVHSVLGSFAPNFDRQGIRVHWDREAAGRAVVQGNTALYRQAIHSVVSNAVEAMPEGGEMRVEVREVSHPKGVELTVSDTGVGMSTQQLGALFRPFHTTKAHGLGIGLPMLQRAMQRFGGSVTLSSAERAGTRVRLFFPEQEAR